jgi:hypothetical protein
MSESLSVLDYQLVGIALLCLLLAGVWGFYWPRAWVWRWIDIAYYPIAIGSVILLFIANENARNLADLRAEQLRVEQQRREHLAAQPPVQGIKLGSASFASDYDLIQSEVRLGRACAYSGEISCVPARDHEKLIVAAFDGFPPASTPGDPLAPAVYATEFCRRGFQLLDQLAGGNGAASEIFQKLKASFTELSGRHLAETDYGTTNKDYEQFRQGLDQDITALLPRLAEARRATYQSLWEENARFAASMYLALADCLRIPARQAELVETMKKWRAELPALDAARESVQSRMAEADKRTPGSLELFFAFVQLRLWPFALAFALSLKFAKGVAAVRA